MRGIPPTVRSLPLLTISLILPADCHLRPDEGAEDADQEHAHAVAGAEVQQVCAIPGNGASLASVARNVCNVGMCVHVCTSECICVHAYECACECMCGLGGARLNRPKVAALFLVICAFPSRLQLPETKSKRNAKKCKNPFFAKIK